MSNRWEDDGAGGRHIGTLRSPRLVGAAFASLLAGAFLSAPGCLNPRPEELPSSLEPVPSAPVVDSPRETCEDNPLLTGCAAPVPDQDLNGNPASPGNAEAEPASPGADNVDAGAGGAEDDSNGNGPEGDDSDGDDSDSDGSDADPTPRDAGASTDSRANSDAGQTRGGPHIEPGPRSSNP